MTKVQLSLTSQEATILSGYGTQFGYNLPKTIRFIISKASENILQLTSIPTFPMSKEIEQKGFQALKEYREGKTIEVEDVKEFFNSL